MPLKHKGGETQRGSKSRRTADISRGHALKDKEKQAEADNTQPHVTFFARPVSTRRCDETRVEKISLLITKMVTRDMLHYVLWKEKASES